MTLLWIFLFLYCPATLDACGISTHTEIGYRALEFLGSSDVADDQFIRSVLLEHQDAFQAGHPFPDSFYNTLCYHGQYHDQSEDTHWGQFVKVAFQFVNEKYPLPWDNDTEKLVAFLFGIISHQVADISWHGLEGLSDGFLPVLGNLGFHGSFGTAHDFGDVADDMIGVFEWNVTSYATEWYVPVQDLVEIYEAYYGGPNEMTADIVDVCSGMLLVGRVAEQAAGKLLYYEYAKRSPVMLDMYRDYFMGGLDDMSTWTNIVWRQAIKALLYGTEGCEIPHNTLGVNCDKNKDMAWIKDMMSKNLYHHPLDLSHLEFLPTFEDLEFTPEGRGVRIKISKKKINNAIKHAEAELGFDDENEKVEDPSDLQPSHTITTRSAYATLGKALQLADLDGDGRTDLVVGAPGVRGCVYVLLDYKEILPEDVVIIEDIADITICGDNEYGRFGTSLAVLDINGDGVKDLVVGEPYSGADTLTYDGGVQVFFGKREGTEFILEKGFSIKCEESPCGLGSKMTLMDYSPPELLISAPFAGAGGRQRGGVVGVGQVGNWEIGREYLVPSEIPFYVTGEMDFQQLGSSLIRTTIGFDAFGSSNFRVSMAEDGSYSEEDIQAAGHVKILMPNSTQDLVGSSEFGSLGCSLAAVNMTLHGVSRPLLAVGECSADSRGGGYLQTGNVLLYEVDYLAGSIEQVASFSGNSEIGRFGMSLVPGWDGGFLVGAPYTGLGLENYGKVYYYSGHTSIPGGDVTSHCSAAPVPCPGVWAELELTQHEQESLFGSGLDWEVEEGEVMLVVAAERSSLGARIAGSLYIYKPMH